MKHYHYIDSEEFRNLITTPESQQKKCENCNGTGWESWNEDGEDIRAGRSNDKDRVDGECQTCKGVGYVF